MKSTTRLNNILKTRPVFLDGASGTFLHSSGMPSGVSPEIWASENTSLLKSMHTEYKKAGSDVIYACSFGANRVKLAQYGYDDVFSLNKKLAEIACEAAGGDILVAGDIGPTGKFVEPFGPLSFEDAVKIYTEQAKGLLKGGVDLFVVETMMDIQEARAALIAIRELCELPVLVTMTYERNGATLNGTTPVAALITLQSLGAFAVGCNCSTGPVGMLPFIKAMKPYAKVPLIAKPNAGMPQLVDGVTRFPMGPDEFAGFAEQFIEAGAALLGGCCGTTPAHIDKLKKKAVRLKPVAGISSSVPCVSSVAGCVELNPSGPLVVVGERINPTGKKALQKELSEGKTSLVRKIAKEQEKAGAQLLDVNVGMPDINEPELLKDITMALAIVTSCPLVIDSSSPDAIESALRVYPGRALINSISAEKEKLKKLLPIAAKYGAMFIALPLADGNLPQTAVERKKIVSNIIASAGRHGIVQEDIVVDALAMTVASQPSSALETLEVIRWCSKQLHINTILGLSNISFGLPKRVWVNSAFAAMAQSAGLSIAILNPSNKEVSAIKRAADVLLAKDKNAQRYIDFITSEDSADATGKEGQALSPSDKVYQSVLEGDRDAIISHIKEAMDTGIQASELVNTTMIPAILKTGELFDCKSYFLPQLIASAETMKTAFEFLKPHLSCDEALSAKKGLVLLATVKGDIHDIGKNIVSLMLKNHGFEVIDLGKDVSAKTIVDSVKVHKPDVVGLSALMTTTMVAMKDVMALAAKEGVKCSFMVGGAVVTEEYAGSIGAQYAKDSVKAVKIMEKIIEDKKK